jgi:Putative metal-binding motif
MINERKLNRYGLCISVLTGSASLLAACSTDFENCAESRTCPAEATGGAVGGGGELPAESAGGGTSPPGEGGVSGAIEPPVDDGPWAGGSGGGGGGGGDGAYVEGPEPGGAATGGAAAGGAAAGGAAAGGGGAGEAGAAGSGDAAPTPACVVDADCSDRLACNGAEQCELGVCIPGAPPSCKNPDPTHCKQACVEKAGGYDCVTTSLDGDGDGHGSRLCAAKPGDDCDDTKATISPSAVELCDGIDNDCDAKLDLNDGLGFSGAQRLLTRNLSETAEHSTVAWSDDAKLFGFLWVAGGSDLVFAAYDVKSTLKLGPLTVATDAELVNAPVLASGPGGFGIAWLSGEVVKMRTLGATGQLGAPVVLEGLEGYGALALTWSTKAKAWGLVADHGTATIDGNGVASELRHRLNKNLTIEGADILPTATGFLVAVSSNVGEVVDPRLSSFDAEFGEQRFLGVENPSNSSRIHAAIRPDGSFATILEATPNHSAFVSYDATGKALCSLYPFLGSTGLASSIVASRTGYTVAFEGLGSAPISLRDVSTKCQEGEVVRSSLFGDLDAKLAAAPTAYALTWQAPGGPSFSIFGSRYCN